MCPRPRSERVVVIGAGHAGVQAADALRAGGHDGPITLVGGEPVLPYQRPPLSKEHLAPGGTPVPLPLRAERFFADRRIDLRTGVTATALDRTSRTVLLDDGAALPYDVLVLATGAANRVPAVPGADLAGIHALRTLGDAQALRAGLSRARSVLVVGAGFVGLEVAAAARAHGPAVTVLEAADRPLARALSREAAGHVAEVHRRAGTDLRLGEAVAAFTGRRGRVTGAVSSAGTEYRADLVLVGTGVAPRTALAAAAGLPVVDGIVVDECLRTPDPAIYAVGDCASHPSVHTGTRIRLESVQNATDQGRHVAAAILGGARPYTGVPWFWSHQGALKLQIAGVRLPGDENVLCGDPATGRFSVCRFRDGRLVVVESLNRPADHMAARRLLAAGRSPEPGRLRDPAFCLKEFAREPAVA
ncbi:3-phenylpropionate/trans-cinnamate dioxygenase ferredoxin reductase subunit [Pseudonocardia hierapolitana]|uniref:3-phenylpropionate/trans-cinnamate dioxygenase ferredoxin reductase subunit n=1 Tax=Pseudonocardia hierapolitana TaxID=1128676 RepID=A0A561SZU5_9PSEU|nr:FAD-dependent oxidoreductase [Pseudonocardia hierapolitana]TWF80388.1 3-phenylpropionate/trans-cinnamate dioxygenase ferredoxin reductase subunit [Pseudonocardia hierapolitana]